MRGWGNAIIWQCGNLKMREFENVKMWGWGNELMQ